MTLTEVSAVVPTSSTEERLVLLDELWASLDSDFVPELTSDLKSLRDEQVAHADAHPDDVMTWDAMKAELRAERGPIRIWMAAGRPHSPSAAAASQMSCSFECRKWRATNGTDSSGRSRNSALKQAPVNSTFLSPH
jgi:hypothetical protein